MAEPDQQPRIARRWPDAVRPDECGRHIHAARGRRSADGRELPRRGHDPHDANGGQPRAFGVRVTHDEPDDAAHPQALTVRGRKIDHRLTGRIQVHHPARDDLEPVQPKTRPPHQIGDGHQLRRRRHPARRQNGRRRRHIDAGPQRDLGQRLHLCQRPPWIDPSEEPAGDQVVTVLRLDEPRIGGLGTPRASRGRHSGRSHQANQKRQAQPCPPPGPQLRAEPHPDRAHNAPSFGRHPAAHCPRTAPRPGSRPAPPSPVVLPPPGPPHPAWSADTARAKGVTSFPHHQRLLPLISRTRTEAGTGAAGDRPRRGKDAQN